MITVEEATLIPAVIAAFFAGITALVIAVGGLALQFYNAKKLQTKVEEVHTLVNGGKTELLTELANVKQIVADSTGTKADQDRANSARELAKVHIDTAEALIKKEQ